MQEIPTLIWEWYEGDHEKAYIATIIAHICICVIGYIGNIITCIVIISNKTMHTTTNVYLFNLAIADLTMLTAGIEFFTKRIWYLSQDSLLLVTSTECFIVSWILRSSFNVSIMTISAFTIERYLAICHPFLARRILSISRAIKLTFLIWIMGIVFGYLITHLQDLQFLKSITPCSWTVNSMANVLEIESLVFFVLPLLLLIAIYILIGKKLAESSKIHKSQGRTKNMEDSETQNDDSMNKKIFIMLIMVVTVFFSTWATFHIGRLIDHHTRLLMSVNDKDWILLIIQSIAYFISSAANPIIYNVLSNKFRNAFKELLLTCWNICPKNCQKTRKTCDDQKSRSTETEI